MNVNFQQAPPGYKLATHAGGWGNGHGNSQYSVSAVIDAAAGGTIQFPAADLTVTFPPGALSQTTTITLVALSGPSIAYDFLPHGIQFSKPVVATQSLVNTAFGGLTGTLPQIYAAYLPDGYETISATLGAHALEIETSSTTLNALGSPVSITWYLNHFSRYILASGDAQTTPDTGS